MCDKIVECYADHSAGGWSKMEKKLIFQICKKFLVENNMRL